METDNIRPLVRASVLNENGQVNFFTLSSKIEVEVDFDTCTRIFALCDGVHTIEDVCDKLSKDFSHDSVRAFLRELLGLGVLVDSRHVFDDFWVSLENPALFPPTISDDHVERLVLEARRCHEFNFGNEVEVGKEPLMNHHVELLNKRTSSRLFSYKDEPSVQSLVNMIWAGYGDLFLHTSRSQNRFIRRTTPSAGALFPLSITLVLFRCVENMSEGVYRVSYKEGRVFFSLCSEDVNAVRRSIIDPVCTINGATGLVVVSGNMSLSAKKYSNRASLYTVLEAGHVAQNLLMEATLQDVATVEIGGFFDRALTKAACLQIGYRPLTTILFGVADIEQKRDDDDDFELEWSYPEETGYSPPFIIVSARLKAGLEDWSHGRDKDPVKALLKAKAEALEWSSCGSIPPLVSARWGDLKGMIHPESVINFHSSQYNAEGFELSRFDPEISYEWAEGYDLLSGDKRFSVADHVYFPYRPPHGKFHAFANSSGCAAHTDKDTAIRTAVLELVERDAFMGAYLCRLSTPSVDIGSLSRDIAQRIRDLEAIGFRVYVKDISLDLAPTIAVFAQSESLRYTTCAACSSFDLEYATGHALMEVEASVLERLRNGQPRPIVPSQVKMPLDHGRLYGQPEHYRKADFMFEGGSSKSLEVSPGVANNWEELLGRIYDLGWEIAIFPLRISEAVARNHGLEIVRAIVPGMLPMTFGFGEEPGGVERIKYISDLFDGQAREYPDLTKFPHPFE